MCWCFVELLEVVLLDEVVVGMLFLCLCECVVVELGNVEVVVLVVIGVL